MALYIGQDRDQIDAAVELWKRQCLLDDGSLLFPDSDRQPWALPVVEELDRRFNGNPLEGSASGGRFSSKWAEQLAGASEDCRLLGAEVLLVHFLFVESVSYPRKRSTIQESLEGTGIELPAGGVAIRALSQSIGHPGIGFNTRRDVQVGYLINFALRFKHLPAERRAELLDSPWELRDFADDTELSIREMRHILLHLLRPVEFERTSSGTHKREIAAAFSGLLAADGPVDVDEQLLAIRREIERLKGTEKIDFYRGELRGVWSSTGGDSEGVGDLEALRWKKQIVLYGPPGTSKTWQARQLAEAVIRRAALDSWGPDTYFRNSDAVENAVRDNVFWLQLHPGYGYEQFIRGLRLEGDVTRYRPGFLPWVVEQLEQRAAGSDLPRLPGVLVLDEINRTNLSEMLGEAFSLLESGQRGTERELPGFDHDHDPDVLVIPEDLYVIGTMNEIDQSVETLDFALRRRFLWRECPFEADTLLAIVEHRWDREVAARFPFEDAVPQLETMADRAQALNDAIAESPELGRQFQIGHTYFADIAFFIGQWVKGRKARPANGTYLWTAARKPQPPLVDLWNRSLEPLIEQYLAGSDVREHELKRFERIFLG
ncbi:AAA family ATPase [Tsukamurella pseudospumae]|uniref:AAA family ATPase n=1 Tax=Tsukamurella pseudospumae TaxID=239498 RepID=UPI00083C9494|nr:AAA family ATPase [Tsukamurella pseudospumae]